MSKKEKVKQRPLALNTVEMLRVASAALGMCKKFRFSYCFKAKYFGFSDKIIKDISNID